MDVFDVAAGLSFNPHYILSMDLKAALTKLKSGGPATSLPFFFCEADSKGKPVVLVGPVSKEAKEKALTGAKSKKTATGKMSIGTDGDLCLKAKGTALTTVTKGVTIAALNAGARAVFKVAVLGEPDKEEEVEEEKEETTPVSKEAPKAPPIPPVPVKKETVVAKTPPPPSKTPYTTPVPKQKTKLSELEAKGKAGYNVSEGYGSTYKPSETEEDEKEETSGGKKLYTTPSGGAGNYGQGGYGGQSGNNPYAVHKGKSEESDEDEDDEDEDEDEKPKTGKSLAPAKKFPDVLRQSPKMAKLMDQRDLLRKKLEEASKQEGVKPELLEAAAKKLEEMEAQLEEAQKELNKTGMVPQQMQSHYEGEDKSTAWQAGAKPVMPPINPKWSPMRVKEEEEKYAKALKIWQSRADSKVSMRKNFSETEKKQSELTVDSEGMVVDSTGKRVTTHEEYVMDNETGKMHQFTPGVKDTGQKVPDYKGNLVDQKERTHHSSVLSGKEVGGAGGIDIVDGEIRSITNVSGHYKPGVGPMIQTVENLLKQGALLDKSWVDKNGRELTGKPAELLSRTKALQKQVAKKLEKDPNANVKADRDNIDKAMQMLSKLGAGPSNKIKEAEVGFLDIKEGMTGQEIKDTISQVKEDAIEAEEFLRTGGGNTEQAEAKDDMHAELEKKMKAKREKLDKESSHTGEGTAGPGESEIDEMTESLEENRQEIKRARKEESEKTKSLFGDGYETDSGSKSGAYPPTQSGSEDEENESEVDEDSPYLEKREDDEKDESEDGEDSPYLEKHEDDEKDESEDGEDSPYLEKQKDDK